MIKVSNLSKIYRLGDNEIKAVDNISLEIKTGEFISIVGTSGSGKSTFANLVGMLDRPSSGSIEILGLDTSNFSDDEMAYTRSRNIGFVFQKFNLLTDLTALENIELPLSYSNQKFEIDRLLEQLQIKGREQHYPNQLSGGQQQRVSVARALVNNPQIIIADEPTGNLDSTNEKEVIQIFRDLHLKGHTIILITHNNEIAQSSDRVITFCDGKIIKDEVINEFSPRNKIESQPSNAKTKNFSQLFEHALRANFANPLRSFLSILGILVGIASVVVVLAIGKGASVALERKLAFFGKNNIEIRPGFQRVGNKVRQGTERKLFLSDIEQINNSITGVQASSGHLEDRTAASTKDHSMSVLFQGIQPGFFLIKDWKVQIGRTFLPEEYESKSRVVLIGTKVMEKLFPSSEPIGKYINISSQVFKVVGVLDHKSGPDWYNPNEFILAPLTTMMSSVLGRDSIDSIFVKGYEGESTARLKEELKNYLLNLKKAAPYERNWILRIHDQSNFRSWLSGSNKIVTNLLRIIAIVSLVVGGIGIMNVLLVNIAERTREIGVRKAIGANNKDILKQFFAESLILCTLGGVLGVIFGVIVSLILGKLMNWSIIIYPSAILIPLSLSVVSGFIFGIYPAFKASKLSPIEAIRTN